MQLVKQPLTKVILELLQQPAKPQLVRFQKIYNEQKNFWEKINLIFSFYIGYSSSQNSQPGHSRKSSSGGESSHER